jgi:hypothetical protein
LDFHRNSSDPLNASKFARIKLQLYSGNLHSRGFIEIHESYSGFHVNGQAHSMMAKDDYLWFIADITFFRFILSQKACENGEKLQLVLAEVVSSSEFRKFSCSADIIWG